MKLASRYHPSILCKGIRGQTSTSPTSTQVRILWRQTQNQQMDSLLPSEQNAERYILKELSPNKFQYSLVYPQGTVLGPLLFLAYINDMPGTLTSSEIKLFADDSFLFRTINNQHDSDLLQRDLTTLEDWENKWQMSFNQKLHYHQNSTEKQTGETNKLQTAWTYSGQCGSQKIPIGVTINNNLSWDRHI